MPRRFNSALDSIRPLLDVDANGAADALTDGLLIIRYMFGLRRDALVAGAVGPNAMRAMPHGRRGVHQVIDALTRRNGWLFAAGAIKNIRRTRMVTMDAFELEAGAPTR